MGSKVWGLGFGAWGLVTNVGIRRCRRSSCRPWESSSLWKNQAQDAGYHATEDREADEKRHGDNDLAGGGPDPFVNDEEAEVVVFFPT